jgi:hypothetical protein
MLPAVLAEIATAVLFMAHPAFACQISLLIPPDLCQKPHRQENATICFITLRKGKNYE